MNLKVDIETVSNDKPEFLVRNCGVHDIQYRGNIVNFGTGKVQEIFKFDTLNEFEQKIYDLCIEYLPKFKYETKINFARLKLDVAKNSGRGQANTEIFDNIWVYVGERDWDRPFYFDHNKSNDKFLLGLNPNFGLMGFILDYD